MGAAAVVRLEDSLTEALNQGSDSVSLRGVVSDLDTATTLALAANLENLDASGADVFRFESTLDADTNFDGISDFVAALDKFELDSAVFDGLAVGTLSAEAFLSGAGLTAATTALQRVLYDNTSGKLYYDADGSGDAASAIAFAQITAVTKPVLSAGDFLAIGPL